MPQRYDATFSTQPPEDLPLSAKVKSFRKAYQDAQKAITDYVSENSRYRTMDVRKIGESEPRYSAVALEEAKRELKNAEIAAVGAGKPLPDKDEFLAPVMAKMDDYKRTVEALKILAAKAKQEYSDTLFGELNQMGLKEAEKAAKARDEWEKAWKAAMEARATLERHATLFTWCVSAGDMGEHPMTDRPDNLAAWQLTDDGRLKYESAVALDFWDSMVKIDGLIEPDPNPPAPIVDEWTVNHIPGQYYSLPTGHENANYVGTIY